VFHILGIDHVVLRVLDMPRMVRFYTEVLGCEVERTVKEIGLVQMRAGQSLVDLIPAERPANGTSDPAPGAHMQAANESPDGRGSERAAGRNMDHFCLRVEPFDQSALIGHLIRHGIVPNEMRTRYGADGYGPSLYINDPEGNVVELKGPPS
jgi:glyoxylase I family protein